MSSENPYQPPQTPTIVKDTAADIERLRRVARAQRQVNLAILLYLVILPLNFILADPNFGEWAQAADALRMILILAALGLGAVSVYKLTALFHGSGVAVFYTIGLLVPYLGLLLLAVVSSKATKELRAAGIKVGLLGANPHFI